MANMKRTLIKRAGVILGLVAILVIGIFFVADYANVTEREVTSWIEADIPIGATKDEVIAFCEKRNIDHSAYYRPELNYEKTRTISASVKSKYTFLLESGVYITFEFDGSDRLESYEVDEVFTFL
ncbi:hypothetical protein ACFL3A_01155 [Pseudomonadota bacterium]